MRKIFSRRRTSWPLGELYIIFLPVLSVIYIYIVVKASAIQAGDGQNNLLINLSVGLPVVVVWFLALLSSVRFKSYTEKIKKSADGRALTYIADGLLFLTLWTVLRGSTAFVEQLFEHSSNLNTIVYLENYVPLAVGLTAAFLMLLGTIRLRKIVGCDFSVLTSAIVAVLFLILAVGFTWRFYLVYYHLVPQNGIPKFVGSRTLMLWTYVLPLIVRWAMLVVGGLYLYQYSKKTTGLVYRQLFKDLYIGIVFVFFSTFFVQILLDSNWSIGKINILSYIAILAAAIGFVEIYRGATRLKRIEEV